MTQDQSDKSLLRCTIKKSADVFAKLVLWVSYVVCGITALSLAGYGTFALYSIASKPMRELAVSIWDTAGAAFSAVISLLAAIPWYAYVGVAAVATIPVYSLLWCIARELTDEDYQSEIAKTVAGILVFVLFIGLGLGLVLGLVLVLGLGLWLGLVLVLGPLGLGLDKTKTFLFLGAYLHYHKRVKEERK